MVAATAPATRVPRVEPPEPDAPSRADPGDGDKPERPATGTKSPVFLRSGPAAERSQDQDSEGPLATPDLSPAARARRLAAEPHPPVPFRSNRHDLRAGLIAIPPPVA